MTFTDVYNAWSEAKYPAISKSNVHGYTASYNVCGTLYNKTFRDIRLAELQNVIDTCGKNYPTLRKLKVLFNQLYDYALKNDICNKDYSEFVDILKYKDKNPNKVERDIFSKAEIDRLWELKDDPFYQTVLMLIYNGCRISELLDLEKETSSDMWKRYIQALLKSLVSFHLSHFSGDGPNKRGSQIPLARNMIPSSILLYISDHPLRSDVEASGLRAVDHVICLRLLRFHIKLHLLEIRGIFLQVELPDVLRDLNELLRGVLFACELNGDVLLHGSFSDPCGCLLGCFCLGLSLLCSCLLGRRLRCGFLYGLCRYFCCSCLLCFCHGLSNSFSAFLPLLQFANLL